MRDSRTGPAAGDLDPDRAEDHVRALGSEQLHAVVPRIAASIRHDPPPASEDAVAPGPARPRATTVDLDGAWTAIPAVPHARADLVLAGAVSLAVWLVAGDPRVALASGLLVGASWVVVRRIDRRIPFSFGQGFVGYRSDLGWPRGVQEDDDVRWDWRSRGAAPEVRSPDGAAGGRD